MGRMKAVVNVEMIDLLLRRSGVVVDYHSSLDYCYSYDSDIRWVCRIDLKAVAAMICHGGRLCNRNLVF